MFGWFKRKPAVDPWVRAYSRVIQAKYDAARTTVENERYWANSDSLGPISATSASVRATIRKRARYEAVESGSFLRGLICSKVNDVVGKGVSVQIRTKNREFNRQCEARWAQWCRRTGFSIKLRAMASAYFIDGESFAERTTNPNLPTDEVQLDILVSECDRWTDPNDAGTDPLYIDGIRYDANGNPVSYTRLNQDPHDSFGDQSTTTLDASEVLHLFKAERPGQRRGVSHLATCLGPAAELRRYRLATIAAAEIASDFAAVMYSEANSFSDAPDEMDENFLRVNLERRAMLTLPAGWRIEQLKANQPTAGFDSFCDHYLQEIGRCTLTPLNIVSGTSRNYNFASGRLDYLLYYNANDIDRALIELLILEKVFAWWLDEALLVSGYLPPIGEKLAEIPHSFRFPPRQPIDIEAQANADETYFNMGFLTDEEYCTRVDKDVEVFYDELEATMQERKARNAPLPGGNPAPAPVPVKVKNNAKAA